MSAPVDVAGALERAGIKYRRAGGWFRIRAAWRDGRGLNVAVRADTGGWVDHAAGEKGGWRELCQRLGIDGPRRNSVAIQKFSPRRQEQDREDASRRIEKARRIWHEADALTAITPYLRDRGFDDDDWVWLSRVVRVGRGWSSQTQQNLDGLVWPIRDPGTGSIIGIQYEFGKGHTLKEMRGRHITSAGAGGFTFGSLEGAESIYIVEGQLTGAGVHKTTGAPVLVLFDAGGMSKIGAATISRIQQEGIKHVVIAGDHDRSKTGERAAEACAARILDVAPFLKVQISLPSSEGDDWLDVMVRSGTEAARRELLDNARALVPAQQQQDGPLGPEPPVLGDVAPIIPFKRLENGGSAARVSLAEAGEKTEKFIERQLRSSTPAICAADPGVGKTHALAKLVNEASDIAFLILSPTIDDAQALVDLIPGATLHAGRNEQNCRQFEAIKSLTDKARAPFAHLCSTCKHGRKDAEGGQCEYMAALAEEVKVRVVVAQHGAGAEESISYKYDGGDAGKQERKIIVDESPAVHHTIEIRQEDLRQWRAAVEVAVPAPDAAADQRTAAKAWVEAMRPALDRLAVALATSPARGHSIIDADAHQDFLRLATSVPRAARSVDGTIAEKVQNANCFQGFPAIIPLRAIEDLGAAIEAGNAYFNDGKIVVVKAGALWKQILKRGALLLDATPSIQQKIEIAEHEGEVLTIRVEQPHLHVKQFASKLYGRNMSAGQVAETAKRARRIADEGGAVLTHSHVRRAVEKNEDEMVGHWGRDHRAHNKWKDVPSITIIGPNMPSPFAQLVEYRHMRSVLASLGVERAVWGGSSSRGQWVREAGWEKRISTWLPDEPDARAWLLDRIGADFAQAIARGRGVRRTVTNPLAVDVYAWVPLVGHGLQVDEIVVETASRHGRRTEALAVVAEGVAEISEHRTRKALSDFVFERTRRRVSNTTLQNMIEEVRARARAENITLDESAQKTCAEARAVLDTTRDAWSATAEADRLHKPAVVMAVLAVAQLSTGTISAQRAGP